MTDDNTVLRLVKKQGEQVERIEHNTSRWGALNAYTHILHAVGVVVMFVMLCIAAGLLAFWMTERSEDQRAIELLQLEVKLLQQQAAVDAAVSEAVKQTMDEYEQRRQEETQ